jgi:hypothetical protein
MEGEDAASTWAAPRQLRQVAHRTVRHMAAAGAARTRAAPSTSLKLPAVCSARSVYSRADDLHATAGEHWTQVAEHVGKHAHQCVSHFLSLPIMDQYEENIELGSYELNPLPGVDVVAPAFVPPTATEPALPPSALPFADAGNPLLAQVRVPPYRDLNDANRTKRDEGGR